MIFGDFQPQCQKLHELIRVHGHEAAVLRGEYQWWGTAEIYEAEIAFGTDFTVNHGGNFARMFLRVATRGIACSYGLGQSQIDVFK